MQLVFWQIKIIFPGIDYCEGSVKNISMILKRATFDNVSVLEVYEKALEVFKDYYQYEEIQGADRKKVEKITGGCI